MATKFIMAQMKRYAEWLNGKGFSPLDKFNRQARMAQFVKEQDKQKEQIKEPTSSESEYKTLEGPFITGFHD
tara:strand:- start:397 stop:612 length:216 start_codon:yes stop_codon:yes gene_type:complete